jgi:hypothetical protein
MYGMGKMPIASSSSSSCFFTGWFACEITVGRPSSESFRNVTVGVSFSSTFVDTCRLSVFGNNTVGTFELISVAPSTSSEKVDGSVAKVVGGTDNLASELPQ